MSLQNCHKIERKLLDSIQNFRTENPDLCDVKFIVGLNKRNQKEILANSTILALGSPYFKAMCFGPLRDPDKPKIISDMQPEVFEKILSFIHGSPDSLEFKSIEEAWSIRYAAQQFLIVDLIEICENYLNSQLTYKNAIKFLSLAHRYKADEFKKKIFRKIKNRYFYILSSANLIYLNPLELFEVIKFYKHIDSEYIVRAILIWSHCLTNNDNEILNKMFKMKFNKFIRWEEVSEETMEKLGEKNIFPIEKIQRDSNNIGHHDISSKQKQMEESQTTCKLEMQFGKSETELNSNKRCSKKRLIFKTTRMYDRRQNIKLPKEGQSFVFDIEGMRVLKEVLRIKSLYGYPIDLDDLSVQYSINHGEKQPVDNLKTIAYHIRHDNQNVFFFELTFSDILLEFGEQFESQNLYIEVKFTPEVLKDLLDFNLNHKFVMNKLTEVTCGLMKLNQRFWQTYVGENLAISSCDSKPKYFFEGCGVPVISQIN